MHLVRAAASISHRVTKGAHSLSHSLARSTSYSSHTFKNHPSIPNKSNKQTDWEWWNFRSCNLIIAPESRDKYLFKTSTGVCKRRRQIFATLLSLYLDKSWKEQFCSRYAHTPLAKQAVVSRNAIKSFALYRENICVCLLASKSALCVYSVLLIFYATLILFT